MTRPGPRRTPATTLGAELDLHVERKRLGGRRGALRPRALEFVAQNLKPWAPLRHLTIPEARRTVIEDHVRARACVAPVAARNELAELKTALRDSQARGQRVDPAIFTLELGKPATREGRALTVDEPRQITAAETVVLRGRSRFRLRREVAVRSVGVPSPLRCQVGCHDCAMDQRQLAGVGLFSSLSKQELEKLARWTDEVSVRAGDELATEGQFAHEFFVIEDGIAEVRQNGEPIAELGPGDFFGEIGLLEAERRTASVVAATPMRVIVMFQREFKQMEQEMPAVADRVRSAIRARLDS